MSRLSDRIKIQGLSKLFFLVVTLTILALFSGSRYAGAAPVNLETATTVSNNFLNHLRTSHTVADIEPIEASENFIGYLVTLAPRGYILIAGDDNRVPVKGYSLSTTFNDLPPAYVDVLYSELGVSAIPVAKSTSLSENSNAPYWQFLTQTSPPVAQASYVSGTFLLTTRWGQGTPYNKFMPLIGDENTLTGCVQTAIAQLMRYHQHPQMGSGTFSQSWSGQTYGTSMARPFNWGNMPNSALGSDVYQQDEIAALMRDIGVMNSADYGLEATSAAFYTNRFERAFGYAPVSSMSSSHADFFSTIRSEIDVLRPLLLSLPGHLTVADGYAADGTGKKIHVNMGWNGADDDYYYLDEDLYAGGYTFSPNHTIYYNLKPCEGAECQPYSPEGNGITPQINSSLDDMALSGATNLRIDGYDLDGDTVSFSAGSTCNSLGVAMAGNILTITSTVPDMYCRVRVLNQSQDGAAYKTFGVLTVDEGDYIGSEYDINGQFADGTEIDTYKVYLNGATTISGNRGYSNQAFFIWVKDEQGSTTVVASTDSAISHTFSPGYYQLSASLRSPTGSYYDYNADMSNYILSISTDVSIEDMAVSLGLFRHPGDVDGDGNVTLADVILSLSILSGMTAVDDMAVADVDFDGKIGLGDVIYSLRANAGL